MLALLLYSCTRPSSELEKTWTFTSNGVMLVENIDISENGEGQRLSSDSTKQLLLVQCLYKNNGQEANGLPTPLLLLKTEADTLKLKNRQTAFCADVFRSPGIFEISVLPKTERRQYLIFEIPQGLDGDLVLLPFYKETAVVSKPCPLDECYQVNLGKMSKLKVLDKFPF